MHGFVFDLAEVPSLQDSVLDDRSPVDDHVARSLRSGRDDDEIGKGPPGNLAKGVSPPF